MDVHSRYFANVLFERYLMKEIRNGKSLDSCNYSTRIFMQQTTSKWRQKSKFRDMDFFAEKTHLVDGEEFLEKTQSFGIFVGFSGHIFSSCGQLGEPV